MNIALDIGHSKGTGARGNGLEEHDVAADHPDVVARMWEFIRASHTEPENPLFKMEIPEV